MRRAWWGVGAALSLMAVWACGGSDPDAPTELGQSSEALTTRSHTSFADTTVSAGSPDQNDQFAETLYAGGSPEQRSFLRFEAGIPGLISSVKLRLYAVDGSSESPRVYQTETDWPTWGVTWNHQPRMFGAPVTRSGAVQADTWVEYDVTSLVKQGGPLTFALVSQSSDAAGFASNAVSGKEPRLVITWATCVQPLTVAITPDFDTWVEESSPTARHASDGRLLVDSSPRRESYLWFDVDTAGASIANAKLRIFANNGTAVGPSVHPTQNWSGTDFDWSSRPAIGSELTTTGYVRSGTWIDYDVSSVVSRDGRYGFALLPQSTDSMEAVSAEGASGVRAQLVLGFKANTCAYRGDGTEGTASFIFKFGGMGEETVRALAPTPDGGWVMAGGYMSAGTNYPGTYGGAPLPGMRGFAIARHAVDGAQLWSRGFEGDYTVRGVAVSSSGDVYVTGDYSGTPQIGNDVLPQGASSMFVARFTADGDPVWARGYTSHDGQTTYVSPQAVALSATGDVVLTGMFDGTVDFGGGALMAGPRTTNEPAGMFLLKLTEYGTHQWSKVVAGTAQGPTQGLSLAVDSRGMIDVGGKAAAGANFGDGALSGSGVMPFVAQWRADGTLAWKRVLSGARGRVAGIGTYRDDVYVAGDFSGSFNFAGKAFTALANPAWNPEVAQDMFVGRLSSSGADVWMRKQGSGGAEHATSLAVTPTGRVVVSGYYGPQLSFGGGTLAGSGGFVAEYSSGSGLHRWSRNLFEPQTTGVVSLTTGELLIGEYFYGGYAPGTGYTVEVDRQQFTGNYDDSIVVRLRP